MKKHTYRVIPESEVPTSLVWITPERHNGQIIEVSYSTGIPAGRQVNYAADSGDRYKRIIDHGIGPNAVSYYEIVEVRS